MADGEIKISAFTTQQFDDSDIVPVIYPDENADSGYSNGKMALSEIADGIVNEIDYTQDLTTTSKKISGAINELKGKSFTGTLLAGSTYLSIDCGEWYPTGDMDIYVDQNSYGVAPKTVQITISYPDPGYGIYMTFDAQNHDVDVKVVFR